MRKLISISLVIFICIGICFLTACGSDNSSQNSSSTIDNNETKDIVSTKAPTTGTTKKVETTSPTIDTSEKKAYFLDRLDYLEEYSSTLQSSANTQSEMAAAAKEIYDKYDELLNEVYSYLKEIMPSDKFSIIESDEKDWINKRDIAIEEAASQYVGGTMYGMSRSSAGADETKKRIVELLKYL